MYMYNVQIVQSVHVSVVPHFAKLMSLNLVPETWHGLHMLYMYTVDIFNFSNGTVLISLVQNYM